jgi:hypothetical protein
MHRDILTHPYRLIRLAVVNASFTEDSSGSSGSDSSDVKRVFTLDANLNSMESFINPDVSVALGLKPDGAVMSCASDSSALGVALIQPVTAGIEFRQISKERFPTIRSMNLSMESVSTMLSFEDLGLINQVIERWSPERGSRNFKPEVSQEKTIKFDVVVQTARLGLGLKKSGDVIIVDRVEASSTDVRNGDRLLKVDEVDVSERSLHYVVELLSKKPRPMKLQFLRQTTASDSNAENESSQSPILHCRHDNDNSDSSTLNRKSPLWYQLHFRMGMSNGITIQRSHEGDIPVIGEVNLLDLSRALGLEGDAPGGETLLLLDSVYVPRTGTAIVAVSGLKCVDLGFDETSRVLDEFTKTIHPIEPDILMNTAVYSMSFAELTSSDWGSIDTFEARIAGVALTFIDDFQGRDMPLLRGKLDSIDLRCNRGIGLQTEKIDTVTASVFGTISNAAEHPDSFPLLQEATTAMLDLSRERIVKVSGSYQSEMDYYHPRIAMWEPLLEPSQIALEVVWKPGICSGSQKRPGQFAFEVSDYLETMHRQTLSRRVISNNAVSLNITDAAAEVVARTLRLVKIWKENIAPGTTKSFLSKQPYAMNPARDKDSTVNEAQIVQDDADDSYRKGRNTKRAAAREAAQAALVFAQKRGAHNQMKGDSAKPFLFRNKTGVNLEFCVLVDSASSKSDEFSRRGIAAGCEEHFELEVVSREGDTSPKGVSKVKTNGKKVRSYEGRFPPLAVWMENNEGVFTEPLVDLQVSKVGTFVRELKILHHTSSGANEGEAVVLPLLWQVELDDNRRILTLSSAVQISSAASGLSLDLGFIRKGFTMEQSPVELLGTVSPGEPFLIPLWMSLRFQECDVYIRPKRASPDLDFGWGTVSVLKYEFQDLERPCWLWSESFSDACSIICKTPQSPQFKVGEICLSCLAAPLTVDSLKGGFLKGSSEKRTDGRRQVFGVVNLVVDSCLALRNMLPIPICWQIADTAMNVVEESSLTSNGATSHLDSGSRVEVFACDVTRKNVLLRVRPTLGIEWSEWVCASIPKENHLKDDKGTYIGSR